MSDFTLVAKPSLIIMYAMIILIIPKNIPIIDGMPITVNGISHQKVSRSIVNEFAIQYKLLTKCPIAKHHPIRNIFILVAFILNFIKYKNKIIEINAAIGLLIGANPKVKITPLNKENIKEI